MKYLENKKNGQEPFSLGILLKLIFDKKWKKYFVSTFRNFQGLFRDQNYFLHKKVIFILKVRFKTFHLTPLYGLSEFFQKSRSMGEGCGR